MINLLLNRDIRCSSFPLKVESTLMTVVYCCCFNIVIDGWFCCWNTMVHNPQGSGGLSSHIDGITT